MTQEEELKIGEVGIRKAQIVKKKKKREQERETYVTLTCATALK